MSYLKIDWKSGQLKLTSKEEEEGYEPYTYQDNQGETITRYKKLLKDGVTGELKSVEIQESNYGVQIAMSLKNGEEWYNIQVPMLDARDQVTEYAIEMARFMPNLELGVTYRVFPYLIPADGKENKYEKRGISFKIGSAEGEKVVPALSWLKNADESIRIPRLDWQENKLTKKKKPTAVSIEKQQEFLAAVLERETTRLLPNESDDSGSGNNSEKPKERFGPPADSGTTSGGKKEEVEEDDDLPF